MIIGGPSFEGLASVKNSSIQLGVVPRACYFSTQEAEAGGIARVCSQPGLRSEIKITLNYIVRPCLKKQTQLISINYLG